VAISKCSHCSGPVEPISRLGEIRFYFCRACKLPFDAAGGVIINLNTLGSAFDPLRTARGMIKGTAPGASPVAKTALEMLAIQGYVDAYVQGMKDGILLAYSQDVDPGGPMGGDSGSLSGASVGSGQDQGQQ
jgi:hypothetical protein